MIRFLPPCLSLILSATIVSLAHAAPPPAPSPLPPAPPPSSLTAPPPPAPAPSKPAWFQLKGMTGECVAMATFPGWLGRSPQAVINLFRQLGTYKSQSIERDPATGYIVRVVVITTTDMTMLFYPSRELCEQERDAGVRNGVLPATPHELE